MTKITLAVTGSIAAYKAADLTSLLTKEGHDVTVLMTKSATQFITPLTLQVLSKNKVHLDIMDEERPELVNHIDLAKILSFSLLHLQLLIQLAVWRKAELMILSLL